MTAVAALSALGLDGGPPQLSQLGLPGLPDLPAVSNDGSSFGSILNAGLEAVDRKVASADRLVQQFAVDDSVPVHQVTIALEEAKGSQEAEQEAEQQISQYTIQSFT